MPKIRTVIFDMDGTLIDSREIVLGAFKHVLEEIGEHYDEAIVSSYIGRLLEHQYEDLAKGHDSKELAKLHRSWQADHKDLLRGFDGLETFLAGLKNQGLNLGVYTSAVRARADLALEGLNIKSYFDAIVCGDEVKRPKPDKEGVETLAGMMNVALGEIVMVGDAEHDILCGKNAGVQTIGITHGFGTKESLVKAKADYIVDNLEELFIKLGQLQNDGS
jgi:pyrophosphatase PpaX